MTSVYIYSIIFPSVRAVEKVVYVKAAHAKLFRQARRQGALIPPLIGRQARDLPALDLSLSIQFFRKMIIYHTTP